MLEVLKIGDLSSMNRPSRIHINTKATFGSRVVDFKSKKAIANEPEFWVLSTENPCWR